MLFVLVKYSNVAKRIYFFKDIVQFSAIDPADFYVEVLRGDTT